MTGPEGPVCHDLEDCHLSASHVQTLLGREADQIARHFRGLFSTETVQACIEDSYQQLGAHARIHTPPCPSWPPGSPANASTPSPRTKE
ncbi:MAG: hypothetical protein LC644_08390, partial [Pseudonocardia sp.]|nr:hypothetical protein [Pseudonocardia sp.]